MTISILAEEIQEATDCSGVAANAAAKAILGRIRNELRAGKAFPLPGLGTLNIKALKERIGVNPATGEKMTVKARQTVRLKASKSFSEELTAASSRKKVSAKPKAVAKPATKPAAKTTAKTVAKATAKPAAKPTIKNASKAPTKNASRAKAPAAPTRRAR